TMGGSATLSSGGLGAAVFGSSASGGTVTVSGTAIGGNGVGGTGASVSLISNGGVNDAVGGATRGTLNLTQTAIGGNSFFPAGNATSTLIGTNPFGSSTYNLSANATGGTGRVAGNAPARAEAPSFNGGEWRSQCIQQRFTSRSRPAALQLGRELAPGRRPGASRREGELGLSAGERRIVGALDLLESLEGLADVRHPSGPLISACSRWRAQVWIHFMAQRSAAGIREYRAHHRRAARLRRFRESRRSGHR